VYEIEGKWCRIGEGRWCSGTYLQRIEDEPQPPELTLEEKVDLLWLEVFGED
jgi:hypothetical protein